MAQFDRAIIAVDCSQFDNHLYRYTASFANLLNIKNIEVVHVVPSRKLFLDAHGDPDSDFSDFNIQDQLMTQIKEQSAENGLIILNENIHILEHNRPFRAIKNFVDDNPIDLAIIGKKDHSMHSGLTAKKIAHHLECNALMVCEASDYEINKILVPYDYDPYSANAIKLASKLPTQIDKIAFHVVRVLDRDHYYGISLSPGYDDQAMKIDEDASAKFFNSLQIDMDSFQQEKSVESYHRIAYKIKETFEHHKADLIIIGAKGHTLIENLLIGSTTEKLVHMVERGAILIVR